MVNSTSGAGWNFGGDNPFSGGNVNMHWWWQNNWRAGLANGTPWIGPVTRRVARESDAGVWHYIDLTTAARCPPQRLVGGDGLGSLQVEANPEVTWRPPRRAPEAKRPATPTTPSGWRTSTTTPARPTTFGGCSSAPWR
jgi:hypothetical protein